MIRFNRIESWFRTAVAPVTLRSPLKWRDYLTCLGATGVSVALLPFPVSAFAAALGVLAVLIAVIDLDRYIIPDAAVLGVLISGLLLVALENADDRVAALTEAVLRALAAGGALYLLRASYHRLTNVHGLGLGDVKLAAAAGPWLMWPTLPFAVAVAAIAALLSVGVRAALLREPLQLRQELPFGAFLAPAVWMSFVIERLWALPV